MQAQDTPAVKLPEGFAEWKVRFHIVSDELRDVVPEPARGADQQQAAARAAQRDALGKRAAALVKQQQTLTPALVAVLDPQTMYAEQADTLLAELAALQKKPAYTATGAEQDAFTAAAAEVQAKVEALEAHNKLIVAEVRKENERRNEIRITHAGREATAVNLFQQTSVKIASLQNPPDENLDNGKAVVASLSNLKAGDAYRTSGASLPDFNAAATAVFDAIRRLEVINKSIADNVKLERDRRLAVRASLKDRFDQVAADTREMMAAKLRTGSPEGEEKQYDVKRQAVEKAQADKAFAGNAARMTDFDNAALSVTAKINELATFGNDIAKGAQAKQAPTAKKSDENLQGRAQELPDRARKSAELVSKLDQAIASEDHVAAIKLINTLRKQHEVDEAFLKTYDEKMKPFTEVLAKASGEDKADFAKKQQEVLAAADTGKSADGALAELEPLGKALVVLQGLRDDLAKLKIRQEALSSSAVPLPGLKQTTANLVVAAAKQIEDSSKLPDARQSLDELGGLLDKAEQFTPALEKAAAGYQPLYNSVPSTDQKTLQAAYTAPIEIADKNGDPTAKLKELSELIKAVSDAKKQFDTLYKAALKDAQNATSSSNELRAAIMTVLEAAKKKANTSFLEAVAGLDEVNKKIPEIKEFLAADREVKAAGKGSSKAQLEKMVTARKKEIIEAYAEDWNLAQAKVKLQNVTPFLEKFGEYDKEYKPMMQMYAPAVSTASPETTRFIKSRVGEANKLVDAVNWDPAYVIVRGLTAILPAVSQYGKVYQTTLAQQKGIVAKADAQQKKVLKETLDAACKSAEDNTAYAPAPYATAQQKLIAAQDEFKLADLYVDELEKLKKEYEDIEKVSPQAPETLKLISEANAALLQEATAAKKLADGRDYQGALQALATHAQAIKNARTQRQQLMKDELTALAKNSPAAASLAALAADGDGLDSLMVLYKTYGAADTKKLLGLLDTQPNVPDKSKLTAGLKTLTKNVGGEGLQALCKGLGGGDAAGDAGAANIGALLVDDVSGETLNGVYKQFKDKPAKLATLVAAGCNANPGLLKALINDRPMQFAKLQEQFDGKEAELRSLLQTGLDDDLERVAEVFNTGLSGDAAKLKQFSDAFPTRADCKDLLDAFDPNDIGESLQGVVRGLTNDKGEAQIGKVKTQFYDSLKGNYPGANFAPMVKKAAKFKKKPIPKIPAVARGEFSSVDMEHLLERHVPDYFDLMNKKNKAGWIKPENSQWPPGTTVEQMKEYTEEAIKAIPANQLILLKAAPATAANEWTTKYAPLIKAGVWVQIGYRKEDDKLHVEQMYPLTYAKAHAKVNRPDGISNGEWNTATTHPDWNTVPVAPTEISGGDLGNIKTALTP